MNILIAPHNDDEGLFASYIIQRAKPMVVVVTDGFQHQKKFGIPIEDRRNESREACRIMDVPVEFLGLPDEDVSTDRIEGALLWKDYKPDILFAPSLSGGNRVHDIVSDVAKKMFGNRVLYYGTYSKESLSPIGEMPLIPTDEERKIKESVLQCYKSQLEINRPHFEAVKDKPEYLSFKQS